MFSCANVLIVDYDIIVQSSDITAHAYNGFGGLTTYGSFAYPYYHLPDIKLMNVTDPDHATQRAFKRSLNTPLITRGYRPVNAPFNNELPLIRFLERNGFNVAYMTGVDAAQSHGFELIMRSKIYISVGHDEYVSGVQRNNIEAARNAGVNLLFLSGNEFYWKVRFEADMEGNDFRTLVCYKESQSNKKIDPLKKVWTGTWRDSRPINPEGPSPENGLTGTIWTVNAQRNDALEVPSIYSKHRFWRNTEVSKMKQGQNLIIKQGILGHEWDEDLDNGYRPPGLQRLSKTIVHNVQMIQDHGSIFDSGTGVHRLVMYKHVSGKNSSIVFGAGTCQFSWGLDDFHDSSSHLDPFRANIYNTRIDYDQSGADKNIQQATINLLADMGVQPETLQHDLVTASPSTDVTPPLSGVTHAELRLDPKSKYPYIYASGWAVDDNFVGSVEVSFDGNATKWHPANDGYVPCKLDETLDTKKSAIVTKLKENGSASSSNSELELLCWTFEYGRLPLQRIGYDTLPKSGSNVRIFSRAIDDSANMEINAQGRVFEMDNSHKGSNGEQHIVGTPKEKVEL